MQLNRFAKYAWFVLVFNIGVVLWGAFVRATGSGAGCGSHWPSCNGQIIPREPAVETIIEAVHRATSGIALILVAGLLVWAFRQYPKGHRVRFGASLASVFIITEALVGAGLVLFGWVADDDSVARTISISIHLINTFILLAWLSITAYWASGGEWFSFQRQGLTGWALGVGMLAVMVLGVTGAITALGDTLFPAESLAAGIQEDFSANAHFLIRLRVWHPVVAILTGFYLIFVASFLAMLHKDMALKRLAWFLVALFVVQLGAGLVNLLLMAPVWMQIIHLLLADLVWISLVLFTAVVLRRPVEAESQAWQPGLAR